LAVVSVIKKVTHAGVAHEAAVVTDAAAAAAAAFTAVVVVLRGLWGGLEGRHALQLLL